MDNKCQNGRKVANLDQRQADRFGKIHIHNYYIYNLLNVYKKDNFKYKDRCKYKKYGLNIYFFKLFFIFKK